jgi:Kef-type K+ transport system membrane component KefB
MDPLVDLALLLFGAKMGGIIFGKLKQPSVVGELIAGIILGPSLLAIVRPSNLVTVVSDLGLLFMILLVSLSIDWKILEGKAEKFTWIELTRIIFVVIMVSSLGLILAWDIYTIVVMGVVIAIASTAIVARTLADMKQLGSQIGQTLMGLEVVDEIVAIVSVAIIANIVSGATIAFEPILTTILVVVGLFVVMGRVGFKFVTRVTSSIQRYGIEEALFAFTILLAFILGSITESLKLASILGVFIAGMLLCRSAQYPIITRKVKEIGESFFIPVFFASVGLTINLFAAYEQLAFIGMIMGLIFAVKIFSALIALKIFHYSFSNAVKIASGFVTLSEMTIVIAAIAVAKLSPAVYLGLVASFVLINTVSPLIINLAFKTNTTVSRKGWG